MVPFRIKDESAADESRDIYDSRIPLPQSLDYYKIKWYIGLTGCAMDLQSVSWMILEYRTINLEVLGEYGIIT